MVVDTGSLATSIESSERTPDAERPVDEADQLSQVVVGAMAEALDAETHEVSPLYESVDPEALDDLFRVRHDGTLRNGGRIAFDHGECEIVVEADQVLVFCD